MVRSAFGGGGMTTGISAQTVSAEPWTATQFLIVAGSVVGDPILKEIGKLSVPPALIPSGCVQSKVGAMFVQPHGGGNVGDMVATNTPFTVTVSTMLIGPGRSAVPVFWMLTSKAQPPSWVQDATVAVLVNLSGDARGTVAQAASLASLRKSAVGT